MAAFVAVIAGCATHSNGKPEDLTEFRERKVLADEPLCEEAVRNYEKAEFESTTTSPAKKELFNRTAYDWRHRDRVRTCTIKLSRRQAQCIASAPSLQYVHNCQAFPELQ